MWLKFLVLIGVVSFAASAVSPRRLFKPDTNEDGELISRFTDPVNGIGYRLPNNTIPLHYDIWLSTDVHAGIFDFNGRVIITIQAVEDTTNITLQCRQITIGNVRLMRSSGGTLQSNVPFTLVPTTEFFVITPNAQLINGTVYLVEITYLGTLRDDDAGFYRSSYTNSSGNRVWLAATQFKSTDARHAFPCYDEPGIRARYSIQIRHDASYEAIANTRVSSRTPEPGTNYVTTKFEEVPSVQTYPLAFIVSDFEYVVNFSGLVPHKIYAKPASMRNGEADFALNASVELLSGFERYLGVAYSLDKMDQAAIPNFAAGATENWGLVTYRENYLLFNEQTSRTTDFENVITSIAHEFTHQWFGNLVAPAWWQYLWLNEGFATLYENHLTSLVYPDGRWIDTFLVSTVHPVLESDANPNIRAMSYYVESPENIDRLFDSVAYRKSGSVLKMFQHAYGDSTWSRGLRYYLTDRSYKTAVPDDLYAGIQEAVNEENNPMIPDVSVAMKSWELQSGFPYLTVSREGSMLTFEQNRFMYANRDSPNLWWIPISYVIGSNPDFTDARADLWIPPTRSVVFFSAGAPKPFTADDWIIVNIQQSGYYRVNYDNTLWNQIITQLSLPGNEFAKIHLFNRAQLIDDSHHLGRAGLIEYDILLGIMNYLEKETDYIPWVSANRANTVFNRYLVGSSVYPHYQAFMRKNVDALFTRLGVNIIPDEPRVDRYARSIATNIACQSQLPSCLTQTNELLQSMIDTGITIHQEIITSIYCNGMRAAGVATFSGMQLRLLNTTIQADRDAMLTSMGCIQNPELLTNFFDFAVHSEAPLSSAERERMLSTSVNSGEASIYPMINFLRDNFDAVNNFGLVPTMASNIASRISNEQQFNDFVSLLNLLQDNGLLTAVQVSSYTNSAVTVISWQAEYLDVIEAFFFGLEETTPNPTEPTRTTTVLTTIRPEDCPIGCTLRIESVEQNVSSKTDELSRQNDELVLEISDLRLRIVELEKLVREINSRP